MNHSFARGFKVSHSIVGGVGGMLGKHAPKMPMPTAPLKAGVGGMVPQRRPGVPARRGVGAADCGCDAALVMQGQHQSVCAAAPRDTVQSLFTTIDDSTADGGTAQLTAQVTAGTMFCPSSFILPDEIAADWRVDSIVFNGNNLITNGQATRGDFFSSKNEFGGRITGCCVPAALSLTVNLTNISGTTASYAQGEFKGIYK
jgi:hypothetical protein